MTVKIAIFSMSGGCGKTTTAINLSAALAQSGKRVLLVDMDHRAIATVILGLSQNTTKIVELLRGDIDVKDVIIKREGRHPFWIVPSTYPACEPQLASLEGRQFLLADAMKDVCCFDFVILDCSSAFSELTVNALTYATNILVPCNMTYIDLICLKRLSESIKLFKNLDVPLNLLGVVMTQFTKRRSVSSEIQEMLQDAFGETLYKTVIRDAVALVEAPSWKKTIFEYNEISSGAVDYRSLADELLIRIKPSC
jgi:chromosome partitioning protein